jgi:hypothetical protein
VSNTIRNIVAAVFILTVLGACSSAYYKTMEGLGIEKRDILVDRVEDARDAQDDASEQFTSALDNAPCGTKHGTGAGRLPGPGFGAQTQSQCTGDRGLAQ